MNCLGQQADGLKYEPGWGWVVSCADFPLTTSFWKGSGPKSCVTCIYYDGRLWTKVPLTRGRTTRASGKPPQDIFRYFRIKCSKISIVSTVSKFTKNNFPAKKIVKILQLLSTNYWKFPHIMPLISRRIWLRCKGGRAKQVCIQSVASVHGYY
jgi:hypothetical protein